MPAATSGPPPSRGAVPWRASLEGKEERTEDPSRSERRPSSLGSERGAAPPNIPHTRTTGSADPGGGRNSRPRVRKALIFLATSKLRVWSHASRTFAKPQPRPANAGITCDRALEPGGSTRNARSTSAASDYVVAFSSNAPGGNRDPAGSDFGAPETTKPPMVRGFAVDYGRLTTADVEEAPPGIEPGMVDLQSTALPLGYGAL